jgi:predicted DNA-binding transcriptional regulator AlpA
MAAMNQKGNGTLTSQEPLWSAHDLARFLNISIDAVYQRRHRGTIPPAVRTGLIQLRWRPADVAAWLEAGQEPTVKAS